MDLVMHIRTAVTLGEELQAQVVAMQFIGVQGRLDSLTALLKRVYEQAWTSGCGTDTRLAMQSAHGHFCTCISHFDLMCMHLALEVRAVQQQRPALPPPADAWMAEYVA